MPLCDLRKSHEDHNRTKLPDQTRLVDTTHDPCAVRTDFPIFCFENNYHLNVKSTFGFNSFARDFYFKLKNNNFVLKLFLETMQLEKIMTIFYLRNIKLVIVIGEPFVH